MNHRNQSLTQRFIWLAAIVISLSSLLLLIWLFNQAARPDLSGLPGSTTSSTTQSANEVSIASSISHVEPVPVGRYSYGGSATMVPIRQEIEPVVKETFPKFQLRYTNPANTAPSSGLGIRLLVSGTLSFSDSSRPIRPAEYETANQKGFELQQIPIAIDGIAIVVHPELNINGLTIQQLSDIYQGRVTNWSEIGGPDLEIQPFSMSPSTSGTASFFVKTILDDAAFGANIKIINETTPTLRKLIETPGSIYYASASLVVPQCSVKTLPIASAEGRPFVPPYQTPPVNIDDCPQRRNQLNLETFRNGTYPLTRRLFVVIKKDGLNDELAGQAYGNILLSTEGQTLIEEAGFVRIR
ncbi:MAG: PstS family phosphate ABC transporter substrate-binding protein [Cyanobacteria bacterium P01_F01_bin.86]